MPRLFNFSLAKTVSTTYTSSQTVTIPAGTTKVNLVGRGGTGQPESGGSYGPNVANSAYVTSVTYNNSAVPFYTGQLRWEYAQGRGADLVSKMNGGGVSNYNVVDYVQTDNGYNINNNTASLSGTVVPGTAYTYRSSGWKTSGPVSPGDVGFEYVAWQEYGTYTPGSPATTGASATGFGKTFPGGYGGVAAQQSFPDVPVVPGPYQLNIPFGAFITVSYQVG